jgi:hypothetical protein
MRAREIAREIFGLVIRLLGVVFLYRAVEAVPALWNWLSIGFRHNWANIFYSLFIIAWQAAVAWWLLKGAPPIMEWAYPEEKRE